MIAIVEFLWFFSYLLTGLAMDMGWYSLLHAHEFSWNVYEVKAFEDMWYVFTAIALLLYCAVRAGRSTFIARTQFSSDGEKYEQVEEALCASNSRVGDVRELIHELARKRVLRCFSLKKPQRC